MTQLAITPEAAPVDRAPPPVEPERTRLVEGGRGASGTYQCQSKLCCPKFKNSSGRCPMCHRIGVPK